MHTRNNIFETTFENDLNELYKIVIVIGDIIDLTTPPTISLPNGLFKKEINITAGYPDEIPYGVPDPATMTIEIDMSRLTGNFIDMRKWLIAGGSYRIDGGLRVGIDIPNRIQLLKYNGTDYDLIFDGVQMSKGETSISFEYINERRFEYFKIECMDLTCYGMQKMIVPNIITGTPDIATADSYRVKVYLDSLSNIFYYYGGGYTASDVGHFYLFSEYYTQVQTNVNLMMLLLKRNYIVNNNIALSYSSHPLSQTTFYRTETTNNTYGVTAESNFRIMAYIKTAGGVEIGGLLSELSPESWVKNYKTLWDWFKAISEAFLIRVYIMASSTTTLYCSPICYIGVSLSDTDFIKQDSYSIDFSYNKVEQVSTVLSDLQDRDSNEYTQQNSIYNDNSMDIDLCLHTANCTPTSLIDGGGNTQIDHYLRIIGLYYKATNIFKVDDYCVYDLGDGLTYNNSTWLSTNFYPDIPELLFGAYIQNRLNHVGSHIVWQDAILSFFGNPNNSKIELECYNSTINFRHIGNNYVLNLNTILDVNYLVPPLLDKAIATKIDTDIVKGTSKVTFFIRGV